VISLLPSGFRLRWSGGPKTDIREIRHPHRPFPFHPLDEKSNLPSPARDRGAMRERLLTYSKTVFVCPGSVAILFYRPDGSRSIIIFIFLREIRFPRF
jgi:hypothetical protein